MHTISVQTWRKFLKRYLIKSRLDYKTYFVLIVETEYVLNRFFLNPLRRLVAGQVVHEDVLRAPLLARRAVRPRRRVRRHGRIHLRPPREGQRAGHAAEGRRRQDEDAQRALQHHR